MRGLTRRRVAAATGLAVAAAFRAAPARAQAPPHGEPLAVVTLRVGPADEAGFLHDLADYLQKYGFNVAGHPGGPVMDGRAVFLAWFVREDGLSLLVTDMAAAQMMQAFFYGRSDGTGGPVAEQLVQDYVRKMGSYPTFDTPSKTP